MDRSGRVSSTATRSVTTEPLTASETILANYPTILTRTDFSITVTTTTTGTIYKSADSSQYDNDGEVYYFAGNPTDNWVYFGGFYWRIIRINGDGSIRMIYQGTNTSGNGLIQTSPFNSSYNDNMYVGLKYASGNVHGTGTNSTILTALNTWYSSNLASYADKIDGNAGFCGDRQPSTSMTSFNNQGGTYRTLTYYKADFRLVRYKQPIFKCEVGSDLYTTSESNQGNKALQYPIGLITADEVAYAGGVYDVSNVGYYLYTGQLYWTMSPHEYNNSSAQVFFINSDGSLNEIMVAYAAGVRPVINLKADTKFEGSGTSSDPYTVVG